MSPCQQGGRQLPHAAAGVPGGGMSHTAQTHHPAAGRAGTQPAQLEEASATKALVRKPLGRGMKRKFCRAYSSSCK